MWRRWLLPLLLVVPAVASGAASFKNAEFSIELDSDWTQAPVRFVDHVVFLSRSRNLSLKMDSAPAPLKRRTATEAMQALIEAGIKREQSESRGLDLTIVSQGVSGGGNAVMGSYSGHDQRRAFKWIGFIENHKFVYLYFETEPKNEGQLGAAIQGVLANFRILP